ncbi:MAG: hypothetical protein K2G03_05455 [Bacilli bacterium]|nr:hypothetical protein [Bacilli bacterium]
MAKNKFEEKTIKRAENILTKFPNDDTVYYKELKKSYDEYKKIVNIPLFLLHL